MSVECRSNDTPQTVSCVDTMVLAIRVGKDVRISQLEDFVRQDFGPSVGVESTLLV